MNEIFGIVVDMKVSDGYVEYCRFFMDMGSDVAEETFEQLLGTSGKRSDLPLRISLVRMDNLPHEIRRVKYCKLDELAWNCRLITREIFKFYNMEK